MELKEIQEQLAYGRFRYYVFPSVLLGKSLKKYMKEMPEATEYDLLGQLDYKTWQINKDMKALASKLQADEKFMEAIEEGADVLAKKYPETWQFVEDFLAKHGYKSEFNCYPFSTTSWNEKPERLLGLLKQMSRMASEDNIEESTYEKLKAHMLEKAGSKRDQVERNLEDYRLCHVKREASQYLWEKCFALMRRILRRLQAIWQITDVSELWYLTYEELLNACVNGFSVVEENKITVRKGYRKEVEAYYMQLSTWLISDDDHEEGFSGVSGSHGVVMGRACVIHKKSEFSKLQKGDILICPFTNPEWAPLFAIAAVGVVFGFMSIIQAFGFLFGHGSGNYISKMLGQQKNEEAAKMAITGLACSMMVGVLLMVLSLCFSEHIAVCLGATKLIKADTASYLRALAFGIPFLSGGLTLNNQLRFQGKAFYGMFGIGLGGILNVILDPLLIFGLHMGVKGAGVATALSQFLSFTFLLYLNENPNPPAMLGRME